jgi:predicted N-acyltransferase
VADLEITLHGSIGEIAQAEWDALFPGEPEGSAYLKAVEDAEIPGFELFYVAVRRGGRLVAAAPGFITDYRLDTTVQGPWRRLTGAIHRIAPVLLRQTLIALGSPVTETASVGVLEGAADREILIAALYEGLERKARTGGVRLLAVKDLPSASVDAARAAIGAGLNPMSSLPTAVLELNGLTDLDDYLARLSPATRKDLRRKLKKGDVTVERATDLRPHAEAIDSLYAATRARAAMQFEALSWRYFQAVLDRLGENAAVLLYRYDGEVIGFSLLVGSGPVWVDKYFCTDERGPAHNLYFLSWLENVRFVLAQGGARLVAGQTGYETKLRFGCRLETTTIYFRHLFAPVNAVLAILSRRLGVEETDPGLKARAASTSAARPATPAVMILSPPHDSIVPPQDRALQDQQLGHYPRRFGDRPACAADAVLLDLAEP